MGRRPHLVLINPNQLDDSEIIDYGDFDVHRGYSRPRMVHNTNNDDEVSDQVAFRLWIARIRALEKFRELNS
jgi:hypothetical protein